MSECFVFFVIGVGNIVQVVVNIVGVESGVDCCGKSVFFVVSGGGIVMIDCLIYCCFKCVVGQIVGVGFFKVVVDLGFGYQCGFLGNFFYVGEDLFSVGYFWCVD